MSSDSDCVPECSICLESLTDCNKVLPCQHTFHRECLQQVEERGQLWRCPECRLALNIIHIDSLPTNVTLNRLIERRRQKGKSRRQKAPSPEHGLTDSETDQVLKTMDATMTGDKQTSRKQLVSSSSDEQEPFIDPHRPSTSTSHRHGARGPRPPQEAVRTVFLQTRLNQGTYDSSSPLRPMNNFTRVYNTYNQDNDEYANTSDEEFIDDDNSYADEESFVSEDSNLEEEEHSSSEAEVSNVTRKRGRRSAKAEPKIAKKEVIRQVKIAKRKGKTKIQRVKCKTGEKTDDRGSGSESEDEYVRRTRRQASKTSRRKLAYDETSSSNSGSEEKWENTRKKKRKVKVSETDSDSDRPKSQGKNRKSVKGKGRRPKQQNHDSSESQSDTEDENHTARNIRAKQRPSVKLKTKTRQISESDSDPENDCEKSERGKQSSEVRRGEKGKKVAKQLDEKHSGELSESSESEVTRRSQRGKISSGINRRGKGKNITKQVIEKHSEEQSDSKEEEGGKGERKAVGGRITRSRVCVKSSDEKREGTGMNEVTGVNNEAAGDREVGRNASESSEDSWRIGKFANQPKHVRKRSIQTRSVVEGSACEEAGGSDIKTQDNTCANTGGNLEDGNDPVSEGEVISPRKTRRVKLLESESSGEEEGKKKEEETGSGGSETEGVEDTEDVNATLQYEMEGAEEEKLSNTDESEDKKGSGRLPKQSQRILNSVGKRQQAKEAERLKALEKFHALRKKDKS